MTQAAIFQRGKSMKLLNLANLKSPIMKSVVFLLFLFPLFCSAHPGHTEEINFLNGLSHPFSGMDHFLVMLLVGFWSAKSLKNIWFGPLFFITGMALGSTIGLLYIPYTWLEYAISGSVIAMGLLLLSQLNFSQKPIIGLLAVFGVFHGLAHSELLPAVNASNDVELIQDLLGLVVSTALLHAFGVLSSKLLFKKMNLVSKTAGLGTVIYGLVLIGQLATS